MSKKCLFITSQFPPLLVSGCRRAAGVSKYLAKQGWRVVVITPHDGYVPYLTANKSFISQSILHVKTNTLSPRVYEETKRTTNIFKLGLSHILKHILVPDRMLAWMPYAYGEAKKIMSRERFDILYSTGEYFSSHLIAMMLKKITSTPWVAEFRDPWSSNPLTQRKNFVKKCIEKNLEYAVLCTADAIISVTPNLTNELAKLHPSIDSKKFFTVPSGFDHESYQEHPHTQHSVFTICYSGTIRFREKRFFAFLIALRNLVRNKKIDPEKIVVSLWGWPDHSTPYRCLVKEWGLEKIISFRGHISFTDAIQEEQKSHVLLFLDNDESIQVSAPAKLYEYLGAGCSILGLTYSNSFASMVISQTQTGRLVYENFIPDIENALYSLYMEYYTNGSISYHPDSETLSQYRYEHRAQEINSIFCSLIS